MKHSTRFRRTKNSRNFAMPSGIYRVQCRRAFVLKKVYGYSQREIAQELELSESTVEKHIANGVKRCTYFMMQRMAETSPDAGHTRSASRL